MRELFHHRARRVRIIHQSNRHRHCEQQPKRIDRNISLSTSNFLATVVSAAPTSFARIDALAIDASSAGLYFLARCFKHSDCPNQPIVNPLKRAIVTPFGEVVVHRTLWKQVMGDHVPLATAAALIQDRVEHFPHVNAPRTTAFATLASWGYQFANDLPLMVGEVAGISFSLAVSHRTLR